MCPAAPRQSMSPFLSQLGPCPRGKELVQFQESRWESGTALDHVSRSKLGQQITVAQHLGCGNRAPGTAGQREQSAGPARSRTPDGIPAVSTRPVLDSYSEHICPSGPPAQDTNISQLRYLTAPLTPFPKAHQGKPILTGTKICLQPVSNTMSCNILSEMPLNKVCPGGRLAKWRLNNRFSSLRVSTNCFLNVDDTKAFSS